VGSATVGRLRCERIQPLCLHLGLRVPSANRPKCTVSTTTTTTTTDDTCMPRGMQERGETARGGRFDLLSSCPSLCHERSPACRSLRPPLTSTHTDTLTHSLTHAHIHTHTHTHTRGGGEMGETPSPPQARKQSVVAIEKIREFGTQKVGVRACEWTRGRVDAAM
jgi:hypothetical protein